MFQQRGIFRVRVHLGANLHLGELVELEGYGLEPMAGSPSWPLTYPSRMGPPEVKKLGRRGDCRTVDLGCYFHTHDFEEDPNAPTVVEMRETTKGFRKWSRQYPHFLTNLQTVIKTNGPGAFT